MGAVKSKYKPKPANVEKLTQYLNKANNNMPKKLLYKYGEHN